jgi:hypothetical protein
MASSLVKMGKNLPKVFSQRVKPYGFNRSPRRRIAIPFASALGKPHVNPVGCLVAGALKTLAVDKGLQKEDRMVVYFLPVSGEEPGHAAQDMGGQIRNLNPGQDEEAGILGNKMKVSISVSGWPPDKPIPRGDIPGGSAPTQAGQGAPLMEDHVLKVFPHGLTVTQVMVGLDESLVERFPMGTAHHLEIEGPQFLQRGPNGLPGVKGDVYRPPSAGSASVLDRRQLHQPCLLQAQKEFAAGHGLKHAVSLSPVPETTDLFGNEGPAASLMFFNKGANESNIIVGNRSASDDKETLHEL